MYTGNGAPCGSPCDDVLSGSSGSSGRLFTLMERELLVIPLACILLFSIMLYRAAMTQQRPGSSGGGKSSSSSSKHGGGQNAKSARAKAHSAGSDQMLNHSNNGNNPTKNALLLAAAAQGDDLPVGAVLQGDKGDAHQQQHQHHQHSTNRSSLSYRYFSGLNSFQTWWAEYNREELPPEVGTEEGEGNDDDGNAEDEGNDGPGAALTANNLDVEVAHSQLWQASKWRRVFWYAFGYFFLLCAVVFAAILYGRPVAHTSGLLPWAHLSNWSAVQASLIVVSGVMMIVYFLPLAYLPHDFVAGRAFKNDPEFLKKIGEIMSCYCSYLLYVFQFFQRQPIIFACCVCKDFEL